MINWRGIENDMKIYKVVFIVVVTNLLTFLLAVGLTVGVLTPHILKLRRQIYEQQEIEMSIREQQLEQKLQQEFEEIKKHQQEIKRREIEKDNF